MEDDIGLVLTHWIKGWIRSEPGEITVESTKNNLNAQTFESFECIWIGFKEANPRRVSCFEVGDYLGVVVGGCCPASSDP